MIFSLPPGGIAAGRRVTISASIHSGVVRAYIDTFDASARRALIFVPFSRKPASNDLLYQSFIDAGRVINAIFFQVDFLGAGEQPKSVTSGNFRKTGNYGKHFFMFYRLKAASNTFVRIDKAEHATARERMQLFTEPGKLPNMPMDRMFEIEHDWII